MKKKKWWIASAVMLSLVIYSFSPNHSEELRSQKAAIDFDAFCPNQDGIDIIQILLKMSLTNYKGDILKFGLESPEQHQRRLNYYINGFSKDIYLVSKMDTIPCIDSHFERTYMDSPQRNFILNFRHDRVVGNEKLLILDRTYSGHFIELNIKTQR